MKKYRVTIEETLRRTIEVDAETPGMAVCQVENEYNAEEHILTAEDFFGVDIALSMYDKEAVSALNDKQFVEFVEQKYTDMHCEIDIKDKIIAAFGSIDNALYDYKEHKDMLYHNRPQVYLLYEGDAWLSTSSLTLIAPFTSFENVMTYMRRKKKEFGLRSDDLKQFEEMRQTQGREVNYYCTSEYLDDMPEPEPERPPKEQAFYNKVFKYGQSELSRGELESLPAPFYTYDVTDEQMEEIVRQTELDTRERLRLDEEEQIDMGNDRHSEVWWEEMEAAVCRHNVPYYEDIDEE